MMHYDEAGLQLRPRKKSSFRNVGKGTEIDGMAIEIARKRQILQIKC